MTLIRLMDTDLIRVHPLDLRHLWSIWISNRKYRKYQISKLFFHFCHFLADSLYVLTSIDAPSVATVTVP
jgi:hypothetical protein